ncbi:MAG: arylsulfotransferase family protein [Holophagae bacterium]
MSRTIAFALAIVLCGCDWLDTGPDPVEGFMARVDDAANLDELHEDIPFLDAEQWVELYRPDSSWAGYTLVLYRRRVPMLIDMRGRVVHSWPDVRAVGRARLDRRGRLLVIGVDDLIKEYDWAGGLVWAYALPREDDLPHHDVITLANDHVLVLAQETATRSDYIQEVDRLGRVVWEWWPRDHLDRHFPDRDRRYPDPTHINSLFELAANRWFAAGDDRFRPGNVLISARNLNAVFIVDRSTGDIVWQHEAGLDFQHEAQMVPRGVLGEGLVVVFNNGYHNRNAYRRSEIRVIDPTDGRLVWSYSDPAFFSTIAGAEQVLPNGNLLVTSSEGGRAFEVTPDKRTVWQWIPPYLPMRAVRYAPDHCPQLAALGAPDRSPVDRDDRPQWVDIELGQFTFRKDYRVETLYGLVREVLKRPKGCAELLLPFDPVVQVAYGFDDRKLDGAPESASFRVTVQRLDGGPIRSVVDDTIDSTSPEPFRDRYVAVSGFGLQRVELCIAVATDPTAEALHRSVFMTNPRSYSRRRSILVRGWREERLSEQEKDLQERQLRAIGYVQ